MLIDYLQKYFYSKEQLLEYTGLDVDEIGSYQSRNIMPKASYSIEIFTRSQSFFGDFSERSNLEYYAKGYVYWLGLLANKSFDPYQYFRTQYNSKIKNLESQLIEVLSRKFKSGLDAHIESEWRHFIDGTYGVCTQSGLPNDIATKEYAIEVINQLTGNGQILELDSVDTNVLTDSIKILDKSIAIFAPHERASSSRAKYIDATLKKYNLVIKPED